MARLEGKIAVVTGAADGIGHAIAEAWRGKARMSSSRDIADAQGEAFVGRSCGRRATWRTTCIATCREEADIAGLIDGAVKKTGRIDVMVNNAAIAIGGMPVTR